MKLTDGERLIAVMLSEVMEVIGANKELDPSLLKTLLCNADDWAIKRHYSGIFDAQGPSAAEVTETTNILWMWGIIEHAISQLAGDEAAEAATWHWTAFNGFDGNHDPHYGIAQTMVHNLDEFQDFKARGMNSHSGASLPRYQTMYAKFDPMLGQNQGKALTFAQLKELCG